jgi:hypothetical protein
MSEEQSIVKREPIEMNGRGLVIRNHSELARLAEAMVRGGIAPKGMLVETAMGIMLFGMELGLSPIQALKDICCINGKFSAYGDAVSGLLNASGKLACAPEVEYTGSGKDLTCTVTLKRRGRPGSYSMSFSLAMAEKNGLLGKDSWQKYPERMLYWRAFTWAARDGFSDVLKGLTTREEAEDSPEPIAEVVSTVVKKSLNLKPEPIGPGGPIEWGSRLEEAPEPTREPGQEG